MSSSCIVSSLDGSIEFSVDPRSLPTVGDLRTELRRRYESLAAASVSFVRSGATLDDSAATLVDGDDAHVTVVVNKRPTASPPAVAIATGLTARDLRDAEDAERAAQIGDALFATNDNPDPSTYEVRLPPVPADVLQSMTDIGFLEQRARARRCCWPASTSKTPSSGSRIASGRQPTLTSRSRLRSSKRSTPWRRAPRHHRVSTRYAAAIDAGVCTFAVTGKQFMPQVVARLRHVQLWRPRRRVACRARAAAIAWPQASAPPKPSRRFYCDCQARPVTRALQTACSSTD
jgi:hypothetical protein